MNLSHPVSAAINANRLPWLLAAAVLSLSMLVANIHNRILMASTALYSASSPVNLAIRPDATPQAQPVPTPSYSQSIPVQTPISSATPVPAQAKQFPRVQPVATPPAGK